MSSVSFAYKVGSVRGIYRDVHIYIGPIPGQRARVGSLTVGVEDVPDLMEVLDSAGFDRITPTPDLVAPPHIQSPGNS